MFPIAGQTAGPNGLTFNTSEMAVPVRDPKNGTLIIFYGAEKVLMYINQ